MLKKTERLNDQKRNVSTNIPGAEHRLLKDFRQLLRHPKVAHSKRNLSPLENSRNSKAAVMYLRDVTKKKVWQNAIEHKVFYLFSWRRLHL